MTLYKGCRLHMIRPDGTLETGGHIEFEVIEVKAEYNDTFEVEHVVRLKTIK